jgi:hypothetical protein
MPRTQQCVRQPLLQQPSRLADGRPAQRRTGPSARATHAGGKRALRAGAARPRARGPAPCSCIRHQLLATGTHAGRRRCPAWGCAAQQGNTGGRERQPILPGTGASLQERGRSGRVTMGRPLPAAPPSRTWMAARRSPESSTQSTQGSSAEPGAEPEELTPGGGEADGAAAAGPAPVASPGGAPKTSLLRWRWSRLNCVASRLSCPLSNSTQPSGTTASAGPLSVTCGPREARAAQVEGAWRHVGSWPPGRRREPHRAAEPQVEHYGEDGAQVGPQQQFHAAEQQRRGAARSLA